MTAFLKDLILTEVELAQHFGKAASTICTMGRTGKLPPFHKISKRGHKLCLRPVVDAWARSDFTAVTKIVIDLSQFPPSLDAAQLAASLRMERESIHVIWSTNPERLPPRRAKGGKEWATHDVVMWIAQGAGVSDLIELETRPITISPNVLAANSSLVALTQQLQASRLSGRGR